ncbi:hypothetical protein VOLCADRAFT_81300 [Volvox carteri f. nagariensis]|uniref:NADH:flavin oxidoreductase/NADH oxidase N-terminal domain-containing protein n=1 Tax=Volvox carteri f. nagariensis TaxID=3068 RepID=D8TX29_VOLCA|nr:uncharacterized protein VOLCADRAFT_81300 [Volvox carteri f. nagariensis]EFJ47936.1 hypothetical protein VOLCADRAFT_81300 [Volvox carteri f. nagariensis]|eukprot:XP_002951042.1 hypothetical protein VOLCADRAFT_81300 [Volvox carteri f. nagariensis]
MMRQVVAPARNTAGIANRTRSASNSVTYHRVGATAVHSSSSSFSSHKPSVAGVRTVVASSAATAPAATATTTTTSQPAHFDVGDGNLIPVPSDVAPLFTSYKLSGGRFQLSNRIVYAPLTRLRAIGSVPQPSAAVYYSQRAVPGTLLISEATIVAPDGLGYMNSPGVYSSEQLEAWKPVVKAVKDKGALFFCQLWHCGRASHPELQPGGAAPLSSSTRPITSPEYVVYTPSGPKQYAVPRAATKEDIKRVVADYARAAKNAIEVAGFDGVEIHGANGYFIDQFIKDSVNDRTDEYGGSIEKRCRLALEVVEAVVAAVGADRVGIRISPFAQFLDAVDSTPYATHTYLVEQLNKYGLSYIHMVEPRILGNTEVESSSDSLEPFRRVYKGTFITAGGFKADTGAAAVTSGQADLVAYGRWYLANPDLHKRFLLNAPLNKYDRNTFYSPGMEGYIDYPTLEELQGQGEDAKQ